MFSFSNIFLFLRFHIDQAITNFFSSSALSFTLRIFWVQFIVLSAIAIWVKPEVQLFQVSSNMGIEIMHDSSPLLLYYKLDIYHLQEFVLPSDFDVSAECHEYITMQTFWFCEVFAYSIIVSTTLAVVVHLSFLLLNYFYS